MRLHKCKALLCAMAMGTTLLGACLSSSADTTSYYFDLEKNTSDISKRTYKAGGNSYETIFYVTPTYFSNNVRYFAASFRLKTHSQYGVDIGLTKANTNVTHTGQDYITPPEEEYYYLYGTYDAAVSSGPAIHVEGRFTP